jgi:type VI secretion system secreted protein Hcp
MADMYAFLQLDPIKGESLDNDHKDWIELQSWSWGAANNSSFAHGSGGGTGKGHVQDMQCSKFMDKASADMMKYCVQGTHIDKGEIHLCKQHKDKKVKYLTIKLKHVIITSYHVGASGDGQLPSESFSLHFVNVDENYKVQKDDGTEENGGDFKWDLQKNAES